MGHSREEVVERTIREFERLDQLVANLSDEDWEKQVPRPEAEEPWTVKDALAHITYWKANTVRRLRLQRKPPEERGLMVHDANHLVFMRWHGCSPAEVLTWHRQVQQQLLDALQDAPEAYFSGKKHSPQWPYDLDGHSAYHRRRDIEKALAEKY